MASEVPLHGDVLDAVVSRVSTLDLLPASRVSKAWHFAALSTLRRSPRLPPWLIIQLQPVGGGGTPRTTAVHAFDPLSRTWRAIVLGPSTSAPFLQAPPLCSYSSRSGVRICAIAHSKLALATDPFGATWRVLEAPRCWRTEPAVAVVGAQVVVIGGISDFDDDPSDVEVWSDVAGGWQPGEPLPEMFRWTESFSVAATERRMYVLDPKQHIISWFCPAIKRWAPARRLRLPDPSVYLSAIGFGNGRLILVGVSGSRVGTTGLRRPESVRLWAVDEETLEVEAEDEVGSMPGEMVKGLVEDDGCGGGGWGLWSIGFLSEGGYGYIYNPAYLKEFFLCEYGCKELHSAGNSGGSSTCRWERFRRPETMEERPLERVVFGCSVVVVDDLRLVQQSEKHSRECSRPNCTEQHFIVDE